VEDLAEGFLSSQSFQTTMLAADQCDQGGFLFRESSTMNYLKSAKHKSADHVALIRIEQLYPLDDLAIKRRLAKYPNAHQACLGTRRTRKHGCLDLYVLADASKINTWYSPAPSASTASGSSRDCSPYVNAKQ
jgi:hypothetical protein